MAISKTQPMRPAEIELVDTVNAQTATLANHTQAIADLNTGLVNEADARSQADTILDGRITNETNQRIEDDNAINAIIGDGFSAQNTITNSLSVTNQQVSLIDSAVTDIQADVANLLSFEGRIQIGNIENIVVPAGSSTSASEDFAQPFDSGADCIVLAQVVTSEQSTLFTYTLIDCTYSGFSYSISNSDADAHTVSLGYVAIRTSA